LEKDARDAKKGLWAEPPWEGRGDKVPSVHLSTYTVLDPVLEFYSAAQ